jgi:superfamily II DNA or RNA helicase
MKATFDRMMWIPKDSISDLVALQNKLTFKIDDETPLLKLFENRGDTIGVPRNFGMTNFQYLEAIDNTVSNKLAFPSIRFSDGLGYRLGQAASVKAITDAIRKRLGVLLQAPCGTGKTLMAMDVASRLGQKTLILVHKNDLADQWHDTGKQFFPGIKMGHCQRDKWNFESGHVVTAMAQTLYARRDSIPDGFWERFGMVIYDEGHRYPARTFEQVMRMPPAKYRLAVSATWRRKDGLNNIWKWHIGPIAHKTEADRLTGDYVQIPWKTSLTDRMFSYGKKINTARYLTSIAKNAPYNKWLAEQLVKASVADRRVLLVSDRKIQVSDVRRRILEGGDGITVGLYVAEHEGKKLSKIQLENAKTCDIIIATYGMMAEGTDIPSLDTLFFGTPRTDVEQVVGRIQRPEKGKSELLIVDPVFQTRYNRRMASKRAIVYERLGFKPQRKE